MKKRHCSQEEEEEDFIFATKALRHEVFDIYFLVPWCLGGYLFKNMPGIGVVWIAVSTFSLVLESLKCE